MEVRQNVFSQGAVDIWNSLPLWIVEGRSLDIFRMETDKDLKDRGTDTEEELRPAEISHDDIEWRDSLEKADSCFCVLCISLKLLHFHS